MLRLVVMSSILIIAGCASTNPGSNPTYKSNEQLEYLEGGSFAYNVLRQVEAEKGVMDSKDENMIQFTYMDTVAKANLLLGDIEGAIKTGHLARELSTHKKDYIVMAVDLRGVDNPRHKVAQLVMNNISEKSPDASFSQIEEKWGYVRFTETSKACFENNKLNADVLVKQGTLKEGYQPSESCDISLELHFSYAANAHLFPNKGGYTTVRVRETSFRGHKDLAGADDYLYKAPRVANEKYNTKYSPAFVQQGELAYLFVTPLVGGDASGPKIKTKNEQSVRRELLPGDLEVYPVYKFFN